MSNEDDYLAESEEPSGGGGYNNSNDNEGQGGKNLRIGRFSLYKPRSTFSSDPKTHGIAIQADLVSRTDEKGNIWSNVWLTAAEQVAAMPKDQSQKKGVKIFDWDKDKALTFKCNNTDISQMLTVLNYIEPNVELFHKSAKGNTTLALDVAQFMTSENIQSRVKLFLEGDSEKGIEPRAQGTNPYSVMFAMKRIKGEYRSCFFQVNEVVEFRLFLEKCLQAMMFSGKI